MCTLLCFCFCLSRAREHHRLPALMKGNRFVDMHAGAYKNITIWHAWRVDDFADTQNPTVEIQPQGHVQHLKRFPVSSDPVEYKSNYSCCCDCVVWNIVLKESGNNNMYLIDECRFILQYQGANVISKYSPIKPPVCSYISFTFVALELVILDAVATSSPNTIHHCCTRVLDCKSKTMCLIHRDLLQMWFLLRLAVYYILVCIHCVWLI